MCNDSFSPQLNYSLQNSRSLKSNHLFLFFVLLFSTNLYSAELPWNSYLIEGFWGTLNAGTSYSQITSVYKDSNGDNFVFLINHLNVSYGSTSIPYSGNGTIILKFSNTSGQLLWWQQMGNESSYAWVNSVLTTSDGKFQVLGGCSFSSGKTLTLGSQSFSYTANGTARFFTATFNPANNTWSNVKFVVNPDESSGYIEQITHFFDKDGNYFLAGKFSANAFLYDNDTIAKKIGNNGINIFTTKLSSAMVRQWSKYSKIENAGTYLHNIFFDSDGNGGAIIAGSIGYITGALSFDGKIVKNDTLSNAYDYSYHDIFIVKIGNTGTVNYAKTFLHSGNENVTYLKSTGDGKLYLCGEYSGSMSILNKNFPALGNSTYYNEFLTCFNAQTGEFVWAEPLNTNIYYSDRQRFFDVDKNNELYFSTRFANPVVNIFGSNYEKRHNANNIVIGKVNILGEKQWINVLGAITTFSGIIEHSSITTFYVGSNLFISVPRRNYGSNKDIGWGPAYEPETTMPNGFDGNTIVINTQTGKLVSGSLTRYSFISEYNANDFTGIYVDFQTYQIYNLSLTGAQISGKVLFENQPITSNQYIGVNLLNANKNSNNFGKITGTASIDAEGKYVFERAPKDDYYINFVTEDATFSAQYYQSNTDQPVLNWKYATKIIANNNKIENLNLWLKKTPIAAGNNTVTVAIDVSKCFNPYLWYYLNIECRLYNKNNNSLVAFARPNEYSNSIYQTTIKNVPAGQYKLIVEFPFVEQVDIPELNLGEMTLTTAVNMNIQNDKMYRNVGDGFTVNKVNVLQLFPNPASDYLILRKDLVKPSKVIFYSVDGKIVKEIHEFYSDKLDIKDLSQGIYLVQIDNFWGRFLKR